MADAANRGNWVEENPQLFVQGLYSENANQQHPLGSIRKLSDGREFIYVKNGAANMVAGQLYQTVVPVIANEANMAITANGTVGDKLIAFTMGNSNLANVANALVGGFAWISTGAGNGHAYKIAKHAAIAANANGTLYLADKLRANITSAASKVSVMSHPCYNVIVKPATKPTGKVQGAATFIVTANYYAWIQKKGPCAVEVDGTVVAGDHVTARAAAGCVNAIAANTSEVDEEVGVCLANNANDHWALIDLKL